MADNLGWWAISGEDLLEMLRQVADGADPDLVYAEAYANGRPDPEFWDKQQHHDGQFPEG